MFWKKKVEEEKEEEEPREVMAVIASGDKQIERQYGRWLGQEPDRVTYHLNTRRLKIFRAGKVVAVWNDVLLVEITGDIQLDLEGM